MDILDCNNYIISTNGGYGNSYHPDRETLAKLLCHPKRDKNKTINLYFNYGIEEIERRTGMLLNEEEAQKHNCKIFERTEVLQCD